LVDKKTKNENDKALLMEIASEARRNEIDFLLFPGGEVQEVFQKIVT